MEPLCGLVGRRISINLNGSQFEGRITSVCMQLYPFREVSVIAHACIDERSVVLSFPIDHPRQDGLSYTLLEDEDNGRV